MKVIKEGVPAAPVGTVASISGGSPSYSDVPDGLFGDGNFTVPSTIDEKPRKRRKDKEEFSDDAKVSLTLPQIKTLLKEMARF